MAESGSEKVPEFGTTVTMSKEQHPLSPSPRLHLQQQPLINGETRLDASAGETLAFSETSR
jgi:hypothetical protein